MSAELLPWRFWKPLYVRLAPPIVPVPAPSVVHVVAVLGPARALPVPAPPFRASAVASIDWSVTVLLLPFRSTTSCVVGTESRVTPKLPSISSAIPFAPPDTVLIVRVSPPATEP